MEMSFSLCCDDGTNIAFHAKTDKTFEEMCAAWDLFTQSVHDVDVNTSTRHSGRHERANILRFLQERNE